MKRRSIFVILVCSFVAIHGQWPFRKDLDWYRNGPEKEWSQRDHDRYYRWRDRLEASRIADSQDEQILRIQKLSLIHI